MATRRVSASAIDWLAFSKKVPKEQISSFNAFKAKSDGYAMKVNALPSSTPAINWSIYENKVAVPGMVAEFKKQYESLTVPYPKDTYTTAIDELEKKTMAEAVTFESACRKNIEEMKLEQARIAAMMPIEEMNMEEFFDACPDQALDPFDKPTMWPHTDDVQPEYIDQMEREGKFDEDH